MTLPASGEDHRDDFDALVDMAFTVAERTLRRGEVVAPALLRVGDDRAAAVVDVLDHADPEAIRALLGRADAELEAGARATAVVYAVDGLQGVDGFAEAVLARLRAPEESLQVALPFRGVGDELDLGEVFGMREP